MLKNHLKLMIAVSLITIGVSSCAGKTVYITKPLDRPPRPVLVNITPEQAKQVPKSIWDRFVIRFLSMRQYAETLESIIDSTHSE